MPRGWFAATGIVKCSKVVRAELDCFLGEYAGRDGGERSEDPKDFGLGLQELPGPSLSHRSRLQIGVHLRALPSLLVSHP